jgi:hypothetical protein
MLALKRKLNLSIYPIFVAGALFLAPFARGQKSAEVLPAPLPPQIFTSKKVFISNAGGDSNYLYSGGPERLYNHFYAALQSWGRYQLVGNPAESDLVLAVSFSNPFTGDNCQRGSTQSVVSGPVSDPQFRLTIIDPVTRVTLWTLTEHVQFAVLQGNRDKNFDQALAALVNDLKNVAGQPAARAVPSSN